jgi:U3 small nucleolar RNA-associated protein 6
MAAASDKARFFLEQSVPELKEYEKKGIFTAQEISSIARKRSDFEHKINARGSTPTDFARYAEFEINVDALRKKRVKRLGIKSSTHNGKRRIFFVFDRGLRKHSGDVGLWMEAIEYAKRQKAYKKVQEMFAQVLRLHPTKADLWISAAQYAIEENGDMTEGRSYLQRGLRFCKRSRQMWLEYGRLEMLYIAKVQARRDILGISYDAGPVSQITAADINPEVGEESESLTLRSLKETPVLAGAIPIAIFDAATAELDALKFALDFFTMLQDFGQVPAARIVAEHVESSLMRDHPQSWCSHVCHIQLPIFGISTTDPEFVAAFRQSLKRLSEARNTLKGSGYEDWVAKWLERLVASADLDEAIKTVAQSVLSGLGR